MSVKIRLHVRCCRDLIRREHLTKPLPFCRIAIDGAATATTTKCPPKGTCEPNWDECFDLSLGRIDSIVIDVLDRNKIHKSNPAKAYLGTFLITAPMIGRLTDSGPQRKSLSNRTHPEVTVKGDILLEIKSRVSRTRPPRVNRQSVPDQLVPAPTSVSANHGSDYYRRDTLHGPPLPRGYERRVTPQGQVYWLNHESGRSTWHDPRFQRNSASHDEQQLPPGWEECFTQNGKKYFKNHTLKITQFTDPRLQEVRKRKQSQLSLHDKLKELRSELAQFFEGDTSLSQKPPLRLEIKRHDVFESSFSQLIKIPAKYLQRRFVVQFDDEEGIDWGGVTREWFYLLSRSMLDPQYGLFEYACQDTNTLQISANSNVNPDHLEYFKFIGKVIGVAIYHGHYLDGGFTLPFYKQILGLPLTLSDLEAVDAELHTSLKWTLENDVKNVLDDQRFVVNYDVFGKTHEEELCPGGGEIRLDDSNKKKYVEYYIKWRFNRGTTEQFNALKKGMNDIVPLNLLKKHFDEKELELVVTGLGTIDVEDWRLNTKYRNMTADAEVARWFWCIVTEMDHLSRAKLLQFATGSSRVPVTGFASLRGATSKDINGIKLFTLALVLDRSPEALPVAHTCFNRIDIPLYESIDIFQTKLAQAVDETMGFQVK